MLKQLTTIALVATTLIGGAAPAMAGQTQQELHYQCESLQQFEAEGNFKAAFWVRSAIVKATPESDLTVTDMCASVGVETL